MINNIPWINKNTRPSKISYMSGGQNYLLSALEMAKGDWSRIGSECFRRIFFTSQWPRSTWSTPHYVRDFRKFCRSLILGTYAFQILEKPIAVGQCWTCHSLPLFQTTPGYTQVIRYPKQPAMPLGFQRSIWWTRCDRTEKRWHHPSLLLLPVWPGQSISATCLVDWPLLSCFFYVGSKVRCYKVLYLHQGKL